MEQTEQLQRIAHMEELYDKSRETVDNLFRAMQQYRVLKNEIKELVDYYQSELWMADFETDREGLIPKDMKRGILTEDAIYDLLADVDRIPKVMEKLL